jgi:hypothetical protein
MDCPHARMRVFLDVESSMAAGNGYPRSGSTVG